MNDQQAQSNPFIGVSGNNALAWEEDISLVEAYETGKGVEARKQPSYQTIQFLNALGKDSVFIRSWLGKGCPDVPNLYQGKPGRAYNVRCDRSGRTLTHLRWEKQQWLRLVKELERQNAPQSQPRKSFPFQEGGWVPYLVVNNGGHKKDEITDCPALFIEFDAPITKEEALLKVAAFSLPPSAIIDSRAGIHVYWFLEQPATPDRWQQCQYRLIEQFESDAGIADYSRCMRLPGFYHLKEGCAPYLVKLQECHANHRYTLEQFDGILPEVPAWRLQAYQDHERLQTDVQGEWNIRDFKHVLNHYKEQGRQGWDTAQCPVHATGDGHSTDSLHINSQTGAYHCHAGCNAKDIYQELCRLSGWQRAGKQQIPMNGASVEPQGKHGEKVVPIRAGQGLSKESLLEQIDSLLASELSGSKLATNMNDLARQSGWQVRDIRELHQQRKQERDEEATAKTALQTDIPKLLAASNQRLQPLDYFWGDGGELATALQTDADAKKVPVEFLITTLIAVAGSLLPGGSKAIIKANGGYTAAPIFRTLVVAPTGRKKTPAQNAILKPLNDLEDAELRQWKADMRAYEAALEQSKQVKKTKGKHPDEEYAPDSPLPEKPSLVQFVVSDVTTEAMLQVHAENPRGLLFYKDEASAFISTQNMYRGGKGDDSEADLAEFNGNRVKKNRVGSEPITISQTHVCRTGSIQTSTLQKLMGDHQDSTGAWARWLICMAPTEPSHIDLTDDVVMDKSLSDCLKALYLNLRAQKMGEYLLSFGAKTIFQAYQHQIVDCLEAEPNEGIKAAYAKAETYLGRLALYLHLVNAALAHDDHKFADPEPVIDEVTMTAATRLVDYYIGQMLLLHNLNAPDKAATGTLLKLQEWAIKKGVPVSAREAKRCGPYAVQKIGTPEIKASFQQLAEAGYGTFDGTVYTANQEGVQGGAA